jgi:endonuclease-3
MPKANSVSNADAVETRQKRLPKILQILKKTYPNVVCALHHQTAFQLLTATILSAQCTDERVNATTPALFAKYPDAKSLANATQADVEAIVKPLGFFRAKAANIIGMAKGLVENHDGNVPSDLAALVELPGVGRKTANVVLGSWFGLASGVVVDTHVKRISHLLGLTDKKTPEQIELDLIELVPQSEWVMYSHRVIHHGRAICIARRPKCSVCPLLKVCPRVGLPPLVG